MSEDPLKEDRKSLEDSINKAVLENDYIVKEHRVSMWELEEKLKVIERLHYVMKDNTLKQAETSKLIELRDKIINGLI